MKILVLDSNSKSIKAVLASAATTNNPEFLVAYADSTDSTFTETGYDGQLNGTTDVTLVAAPASGYKRVVKSITIYNKDTVSAIVYIKYDNNGTQRILEKITLAAGEAWHNDTQAGGGGTGRPSGTDTQVQFNDGGSFGGNSGLVFDKTTTTLTAANLVVSGGLTVNGTTTNINSTNLVVEDKNIVIGDVTTPTDTTANGGGITLLGATNKTITWDSTNNNWTSSEHWNLASAKDFKINNVSVLNATTLGSSVTSSSLTSLGTLASLTVSGAASLATTSGSVAIATTSPSAGYRLHVAGDVRIANLGSESGALQISQESLQAVIQTRYSQPLLFGTLATERMRIDSSGNVGIGTSSPAAGTRLDVQIAGVAAKFTSTNGNNNQIGFSNAANAAYQFYMGSPSADVLQFSNSAGIERARITSTGDLLPGANGTQNFGSSSLRWNTIYTSDLSLSNGIGDWTIVEGEDDLFIYNNKRNRVYKFKLEAVDPSTATPKREV